VLGARPLGSAPRQVWLPSSHVTTVPPDAGGKNFEILGEVSLGCCPISSYNLRSLWTTFPEKPREALCTAMVDFLLSHRPTIVVRGLRGADRPLRRVDRAIDVTAGVFYRRPSDSVVRTAAALSGFQTSDCRTSAPSRRPAFRRRTGKHSSEPDQAGRSQPYSPSVPERKCSPDRAKR
jgi:hypothetical protein